MLFLADENFPLLAVRRLSVLGHDVTHIGLLAPSMPDDAVIDLAVREGRVIMTFDKDFGELAYHRNRYAGAGVILFRVPLTFPLRAIDAIVGTIQSRSDWHGHFSVVEPGRIRMRPL